MATVVAIDAYSLIFRSWHAVNRKDREPGDNVPVEPVLGRLLARIIREISPAYVVAAADPGTKTFRHELAPDYKANRADTDSDLKAQIARALAALESAGVPVHRAPGFEGDDVLAAIGAKMRDGHRLVIVTGDKDLAAIVDQNVDLFLMRQGGEHLLVTADNVDTLFGVPANRICEYKALAGDAGDGIPGVRGIGPVAARKLIADHADWEALLEAIDGMEGRSGNLLREHRDTLMLCYELARMRDDAPVTLDADASRWTASKAAALRALREPVPVGETEQVLMDNWI